jgi:hypothetical protein
VDHPPVNCDDGNLCTIDSCNPASGCASEPKVCQDSDLCSVDSCDPLTGDCVFPPVACPSGQTCNAETGSCESSVACPCNVPGGLFNDYVVGNVPITSCNVVNGNGIQVDNETDDPARAFNTITLGWFCAPPPTIDLSEEVGLACAQLLEQAAANQSVTCTP